MHLQALQRGLQRLHHVCLLHAISRLLPLHRQLPEPCHSLDVSLSTQLWHAHKLQVHRIKGSQCAAAACGLAAKCQLSHSNGRLSLHGSTCGNCQQFSSWEHTW